MNSKQAWVLVDFNQKPVMLVDQMLCEPVAPTMNINGTAPQDLIDAYTEVMTAIRDAEEKLAKIFPHGRDFQTRPASVHDAARLQHDRRRAVLRKLHEEIESMALNVQNQMHERDRARGR